MRDSLERFITALNLLFLLYRWSRESKQNKNKKYKDLYSKNGIDETVRETTLKQRWFFFFVFLLTIFVSSHSFSSRRYRATNRRNCSPSWVPWRPASGAACSPLTWPSASPCSSWPGSPRTSGGRTPRTTAATPVSQYPTAFGS